MATLGIDMRKALANCAWLAFALYLTGCNPQQLYWSANTSTAFQAEKEGDLERAEIELRLALNRASKHLTPQDVSNSLYNLGTFYRRQNQMPEAIRYLSESLKLEESLSGLSSERTGRRLAELAAAYLQDQNFNEGRRLSERLRPLASKYTGQERPVVEAILAEYQKKPEEYTPEIERLQPLASKGDPVAQYQLAAYYEDGRGVAQDYEKALALYMSSARQGYLEAQYYLGVIYDKGRGVPVNDQEARNWYRISADKGYKEAQYNYAVMLMDGRGGPKDEGGAIEWLRKSSAQGYRSATRMLKALQQKP